MHQLDMERAFRERERGEDREGKSERGRGREIDR